jgi:nitronate monooxygenase
VDDYKRMLVESEAADIVYTDFFSGVYGSYLKPSVRRAGFDPEALPEAGKAVMDISRETKAWRDVWSAGQGIGAIHEVVPAAVLVERLATEYRAARERLLGGGA